jgi:signal peptidase I
MIVIKVIRSISSLFLDVAETLVIGASFFLVIYLFFMQPHQVNGRSMMPTFNSGDYILTNKISYRISQPQRGDIIVFGAPPEANCPTGTGCDFIKRILAIPGDRVSIQSNMIFVNDQPLNESYIPDDFETAPGRFIEGRTVTLGPDEYFAVGDNRSFSSDSRSWGPIRKSDIVGKAFFKYWPANEVGWIEHVNYDL